MVSQGQDYASLMDIYHTQLYFEPAAMIPALITVGKTLESLSKGRTTDALKNLMKMAPKTALIERDGEQIELETVFLEGRKETRSRVNTDAVNEEYKSEVTDEIQNRFLRVVHRENEVSERDAGEKYSSDSELDICEFNFT